ncbi:hypothetical protein C8R43DRAFT_942713 [Mycena crocata]|nr:hypothetical protein C8R43DRAFT_942713 [Mycena crocata]
MAEDVASNTASKRHKCEQSTKLPQSHRRPARYRSTDNGHLSQQSIRNYVSRLIDSIEKGNRFDGYSLPVERDGDGEDILDAVLLFVVCTDEDGNSPIEGNPITTEFLLHGLLRSCEPLSGKRTERAGRSKPSTTVCFRSPHSFERSSSPLESPLRERSPRIAHTRFGYMGPERSEYPPSRRSGSRRFGQLPRRSGAYYDEAAGAASTPEPAPVTSTAISLCLVPPALVSLHSNECLADAQYGRWEESEWLDVVEERTPSRVLPSGCRQMLSHQKLVWTENRTPHSHQNSCVDCTDELGRMRREGKVPYTRQNGCLASGCRKLLIVKTMRAGEGGLLFLLCGRATFESGALLPPSGASATFPYAWCSPCQATLRVGLTLNGTASCSFSKVFHHSLS